MSNIPGRDDVPRLRSLFDSMGIDSKRPGLAVRASQGQTATVSGVAFNRAFNAPTDTGTVTRSLKRSGGAARVSAVESPGTRCCDAHAWATS